MLVYFVLLGVTEGMWIVRIPAVKAGLHLTDGLLGASLLVGPAGLVAVMPLAGRLSDQFGSVRLSLPAAAAVAVMPLFLWTASTLAGVMLAVLAFGVAGGMLSVAINAQGVKVEQAYNRPLMASFHACFSVGGLAGALLGGLLAWHQAAVGHPQMDVLAGIVLGGMTLAVVAGCWLPGKPGRRDVPGPAWRRMGGWASGRAGGRISGARRVPRRARAVLAGGVSAARLARAGRPSRPAPSWLVPADRAGPAGPVLRDHRGGGGQLERGLSPGRPRCPAQLRGRRIRRFLPGHGGRAARR